VNIPHPYSSCIESLSATLSSLFPFIQSHNDFWPELNVEGGFKLEIEKAHIGMKQLGHMWNNFANQPISGINEE
jgi:hypothetical protein